ncbi:MAG TPA: hypothetical protein VG147_05580 [Solirubrobacteraceae bacterium]|nr:hypothetical protein [Solirubrobacteraceae bacterium]
MVTVAMLGCGTTHRPGITTRRPGIVTARRPGIVTARRHSASAAQIPKALLLRARPIGAGPRFHPAPTGAVVGRCARGLGPRSAVHVEVFAANRVVIVPAGIGVRPPLTLAAGRIARARCYGALVTLEPTGVVLVREHGPIPLANLFRAWGQPLSPSRLASFEAPPGTRVAVFVDGRRWRGAPGSVPLASHSEIVLEVGPHVPPHISFTFPPGIG